MAASHQLRYIGRRAEMSSCEGAMEASQPLRYIGRRAEMPNCDGAMAASQMRQLRCIGRHMANAMPHVQKE